DRFALDVRRFVTVSQGADALICINRDAIENRVLISPIDVIEIRNGVNLCSGIGILASIVFTNGDEILRLAERKGSQQYGIEDTKDCGVCADTKSKRQNNDCGEERLLSQNP